MQTLEQLLRSTLTSDSTEVKLEIALVVKEFGEQCVHVAVRKYSQAAEDIEYIVQGNTLTPIKK